MNITLETIAEAAKQLSVKDRAALAQTLLKGLDDGVDEDVEALWLEESKRRYDAYLRGEMEARPGQEVMERLRDLVR